MFITAFAFDVDLDPVLDCFSFVSLDPELIGIQNWVFSGVFPDIKGDSVAARDWDRVECAMGTFFPFQEIKLEDWVFHL